MAKFSTLSVLSQKQRQTISSQVENHINATSRDFGDLPLWSPSPDFIEKATHLLDFARALFERCETKQQTLISTLILFEAESGRNGDLVPTIKKAFKKLSKQLVELPILSVAPKVYLCDARLAKSVIPAECDILLTSPPYINVFNYHQNHRAIVELLGFDILSVAKSEIGSNRKNRGNRFRTVVQYALEIEQCLIAFNQILKNGGYAAMVVGRESNVRGIAFKNGAMVSRIAQEGSLFTLESSHERSFVNRFGVTIIEDILIFRKTSNMSTSNVARAVACDALNRALKDAKRDVADDIQNALAEIDKIPASPLQAKTPIL